MRNDDSPGRDPLGRLPHDLPHDLPDDVLDRYLAGECTPTEAALVRRAIHGPDPRAAVRAALQQGDPASVWDSHRAWPLVQRAMGTARPVHRPLRRRLASPWAARRAVLRIAASVTVLLGAGALAREVARRAPEGETRVAMIEVRTGVGERREITLADGSRVTLAPRSALRHPRHFAASRRDVELAGHAFFRVAKDAERPFSVHAPGAVARVLGTEFDVREDAAAGEVDVVVASGRVQLRAASDDSGGPVLTARQLGRLVRSTGAVRVDSAVVLDAYLGWRDGRLRFERRPLGEVVAELAAWYDAAFVVDSTLARRLVSADLRVGEGTSLDGILRGLTVPLDARFTRAGRTVSVVPQ